MVNQTYDVKDSSDFQTYCKRFSLHVYIALNGFKWFKLKCYHAKWICMFNVSSQRRGNLLDTANINKIVVVLPALVVPHVIDDKQVRAKIWDQAGVQRETFFWGIRYTKTVLTFWHVNLSRSNSLSDPIITRLDKWHKSYQTIGYRLPSLRPMTSH